jgi:geranylgeranyl diphosphate synthase type I
MTTVLPDSVSIAQELVEPALRAAVGRLGLLTRQVAGYHMGWIDADGRPSDSVGKALRPTLVLISARAATADPAGGVPGAAAVELVHAFSLLLDDIMDGDRMRRHRPAAWTVFGQAAAILAGDAMVTLAQEILLEEGTGGAQAARFLAAATQELIAGQALDLDFERRDDVQLDECVAMAQKKTASLLACSCSIGALLVGGPPSLVAALAEFGTEIGLAFQLVDDLLGIWGSPEETGKPVLSDLRSRKKSLPIVAALRSGTDAGDRLGELMARPGTLDEEELRLAAALVEEAGGREWAEHEADQRIEAAEKALGKAAMPDAARRDFLDIGRFVTARRN